MTKQTYQPAVIEPKWQERWAAQRAFEAPGPGDPGFDSSKPKYYVLDMFPYPSGAGLHVGHCSGYTATDVVARYRRSLGYNVLHPMGWDAFGLPAEQYAIQTGRHPAATTYANIDNFRRQLQRLGYSYDWSREVATSDPSYFRWTQWIFARLHERGLAYLSDAPVWWCEALGTVLSNDEVVGGRSERGDHPCERRPLRQWMLKITAYAERLLADLDGLAWPEPLKAMQREWIGRSEGAEIDFALEGDATQSVRVFTTRPDTLFGATFMVLAPEHPLVDAITQPAQRAAVADYVRQAAAKSELERTDLAEKKTGVWTGSWARNPVYGEGDPRGRLPIWIADYVILTYGTGAIMAVPAGDERDFDFAQRFGLPVRPIFAPHSGDDAADAEVREGRRCHPGDAPYANCRNDQGLDLTGMDRAGATAAVLDWLTARGCGRARVTYRLRDWLFSRQRYWGEPFPVLYREDGSVELVPSKDLPVLLPDMDDFQPSGRPESPLARATEWVQTRDSQGRPALRETNTMPGAAGSSWYFLRFCDPHNGTAPCSRAASDYWMPVDLYVGGTEHAVGHLLYARFWTKVLCDIGLIAHPEPFAQLYNQGMIQSFAYHDARGATVPASRAVEVDGGFVDAETGERLARMVAKMSKRYGNVINPDDVVAEFGADTLRLYVLYMGPLSDPKPWNPKDVPGVHRFLHRAWRLVVPEDSASGAVHAHLREPRSGGQDEQGVTAAAEAELERSLHRTIHKVGHDIERMAFNTAIAQLMIFVNDATKAPLGSLSRDQAMRFAVILAPFAPHLAEELWSRLGGAGLLARAPWPAVDERLLADDTVGMAVQVNGKVRARIQVAADASREAALAAARAAAAQHLAGKAVAKEIVVPGRLVNFVVR